MISETDIEFLQTVWSRRPFFTYIFFGANIVIFVLMTLAGGTTNEATLIAFGVKSNALIDQGEYWRFVTPIFIHIGLLHLFFNSYALWIVGPQVEKLYGGARFVLLYVATGVAGVAGSYLYQPDGLSAGASGAIFGLFGVLLVFGLRYRQHVPAFFSRTVGTGVLPVIVINLVIGFTIPQIDNSAHLGGLIAGMALAAMVPFERPGSDTPRIFSAIQVGLFSVIFLCFYQVAAHYGGPRFEFRNIYSAWGGRGGSQSSAQQFVDAINNAHRAFTDSMNALESGDKSSMSAAAADVAGAIDKLKDAPSLDSKTDNLAAELLAVLQDQYGLMQDVERAGTMTLMLGRRAAENTRKYRDGMDSFKTWVEAEGDRFGIQLRKPR